jgi:hypothetical protein
MKEIMSPSTARPGIIPINFSRTQLFRLIEILKDADGDDAVIRNIIIRDLKLCLGFDISACVACGQSALLYQELLFQLSSEYPNPDEPPYTEM